MRHDYEYCLCFEFGIIVIEEDELYVFISKIMVLINIGFAGLNLAVCVIGWVEGTNVCSFLVAIGGDMCICDGDGWVAACKEGGKYDINSDVWACMHESCSEWLQLYCVFIMVMI